MGDVCVGPTQTVRRWSLKLLDTGLLYQLLANEGLSQATWGLPKVWGHGGRRGVGRDVRAHAQTCACVFPHTQTCVGDAEMGIC